MVQLTIVPKPVQKSVIEVLEDALRQAKNGDITRIGLVYDLCDGGWVSQFSKSMDARVDGAMLIELGLRRLGFKSEPEETVR